jgi:hypothetical protein
MDRGHIYFSQNWKQNFKVNSVNTFIYAVLRVYNFFNMGTVIFLAELEIYAYREKLLKKYPLG